MKFILGDNQFIGVNHGDHLQAKHSLGLFSDQTRIISFIEQAATNGANGFSFSCSQKMNSLVGQLAIPENFRFFPTFPYAHSYADQLGRGGPIGAGLHVLRGSYLASAIALFDALVKSNFTEIFKILIRNELEKIDLKKVDVIFLNNIFTDLMISWNDKSLLRDLESALKTINPNIALGFMTMNCVKAISLLSSADINAHLCSIINPKGFRMNPSQVEVESVIDDTQIPIWAMSPFASGTCSSCEFWEYVNDKNMNLHGVIFGTTKISRIKEFIDAYST